MIMLSDIKPYFKLRPAFAVVFCLKIFLLLFFSSDFKDKLFMPFINHFLKEFDNPWQYFYETYQKLDVFPYPPLMLYILSLFCLPLMLLDLFSDKYIILQNLFFKMPLLISDLLITFFLLKMFPNKIKEVFIFYFVSPIILYASHMHSQLDLIPAALLFLSIYLLSHRRNALLSSIVFGMAISAKFYVIASLPLIVIYLMKNQRIKDSVFFILIPIVIYVFFALPYISSQGYYNLVLINPKQMLLFDITYKVGNLTIFLPILGVCLLYARFLIYKKINLDLFYIFLVILFAVFVLLVPPSAAWYIWMFPFLSIFFIKYLDKNTRIIYPYLGLNLFYLLFFVFFHSSGYQDLAFLKSPLDLKIDNPKLASVSFTFMGAVMLGIIYLLYRFGVRSNAVYSKSSSVLIGIGGDSGAGKSTLLSDLKSVLGGNLSPIEGDGDHKWERGSQNWQKITHLNPKANYLYTQAENLVLLKAGNTVFRRDYDHNTGKFTEPIKFIPKDFIVISGLHPFYLPIMRKIIDLKIFLDTDEKLRKHWKIIRDAEKGDIIRTKYWNKLRKDRKIQKIYIPSKAVC